MNTVHADWQLRNHFVTINNALEQNLSPWILLQKIKRTRQFVSVEVMILMPDHIVTELIVISHGELYLFSINVVIIFDFKFTDYDVFQIHFYSLNL